MTKERSCVAVSHMAKRATRRDPNAHSFGTPDTNDCAEYLYQKPFPIFNRSTIQVSSLIASVLQELFDQMTLTCQHLDAIDPCLLGVLSGQAKLVDDFQDLADLERPVRRWQREATRP